MSSDSMDFFDSDLENDISSSIHTESIICESFLETFKEVLNLKMNKTELKNKKWIKFLNT